MVRIKQRRRIPKYLLRNDGTFRSMPREGRCGICRAPLTLGPSALVCSDPKCSSSPLVAIDQVPTKVRRMAELRLQWPELVDDAAAFRSELAELAAAEAELEAISTGS